MESTLGILFALEHVSRTRWRCAWLLAAEGVTDGARKRAMSVVCYASSGLEGSIERMRLSELSSMKNRWDKAGFIPLWPGLSH